MSLLRCGCSWDGESTHYCVNYSKYGEPVEKVYGAEPPVCGCDLPRYKRHREPSQCIPLEQVEAFADQHGLKDLGHARALLHIEGFRS